MLRPNVKEYAESGNVRGLHYMFRDALDADPTFENWLDSYTYCEKVPGFFEPHRELTPFDKTRWKEEAYWVQLRMDLMENFSKERYEYLRRVAQVYYAEKIKRIQLERAQRPQPEAAGQGTARQNAAPAEKQQAPQQAPKIKRNAQELEDERIRRLQEELAKKNQKADEAQRSQQKQLAEDRQRLAEEERRRRAEEEEERQRESSRRSNGGYGSKKFLGVALAAVILILAMVLLLHGSPSKAAAVITAQKASQEMLAGLSGSL